MKLTRKQQKFVDEYMIDLNATQAAIRAGYSAKTARETGRENLTKPVIKSAIEEAQKEARKLAKVKLERILEEYKAIAFSSITDFLRFDAKGIHILDSADIEKRLLPALAEVTEAKTANGKTTRLKLHNKIAALDALCRVLGFDGKQDENQDLPPIRIVIDRVDPANISIDTGKGSKQDE